MRSYSSTKAIQLTQLYLDIEAIAEGRRGLWEVFIREFANSATTQDIDVDTTSVYYLL